MAVTAHIYGWTMMIISLDKVRSWLAPPFQRPIRENQRVLELAEQLKADGGSLESTITLGRWEGNLYIVDGQHRCRAFELSGLPEMSMAVVIKAWRAGGNEVPTCTTGAMENAQNMSLDDAAGLRMRRDTERDRSPGYNRIKAVFVRRIREVTHRSVVMPAPAWACHTTGR